MTKVKIGGVILTGFAAYLLLGRVMNLAERSIKDICEAAKWRAYYKAKPEDPIPPGYSRTRQDGYEEDPTGADHSKDNEKQASAAAKNEALKDAIIQGVNGVLDVVKDHLGTSEGQTEAFQKHCRKIITEDGLSMREMAFDEEKYAQQALKCIQGLYWGTTRETAVSIHEICDILGEECADGWYDWGWVKEDILCAQIAKDPDDEQYPWVIKIDGVRKIGDFSTGELYTEWDENLQPIAGELPISEGDTDGDNQNV